MAHNAKTHGGPGIWLDLLFLAMIALSVLGLADTLLKH
jgi:hypothetical protein